MAERRIDNRVAGNIEVGFPGYCLDSRRGANQNRRDETGPRRVDGAL